MPKRLTIPILLALIGASVISASGCQSGQQRVSTALSVSDEINALYEAAYESGDQQSAGEAPASQDRRVETTLPEKEDVFDLHVNEVDAQAFYQALVEDTPFNVVVHPDVQGSITLHLDAISLPEVISIMRSVYGYDAVLTGNTYQIFPDDHRTEIFQVDYLHVSREGRSEMQVSAGEMSDKANNNGSTHRQAATGGNDHGDSSGGVVGTIVHTSSSSRFWHELERTLGAITASDPEARVVVTPQTGLIVVTAKPDDLASIRDYLSRVQTTANRQVILEAKILEVTLREGFQAGIDWNTFGDASGGTFRPTTSIDSEGTVSATAGSDNETGAQFQFGTTDSFNPLGSQFRLFAGFDDFSAVINLLSAQGSVQVLSSPRIATVNNQKAVIKVGEDEFFVTDITTNVVTAGTAINTNDSPELTPFFSGIALDVTPQISSDNNVILHIHPTVSEVREQVKVISGLPVPLAASTTRESDSVIRARSGEIVIIGGLMQNSSIVNRSAAPGVSRLPLLGKLFQSRSSDSTKSELVILVRPIVINHSTSRELVEYSAGRSQRIQSYMKDLGVSSPTPSGIYNSASTDEHTKSTEK